MIGEIVQFFISAIVLGPFFLLLFYVFRFVWHRMSATVSQTTGHSSDPSLDGFEFMDSPDSNRFIRSADLYGHLPLYGTDDE